jgi:hypothetical protein
MISSLELDQSAETMVRILKYEIEHGMNPIRDRIGLENDADRATRAVAAIAKARRRRIQNESPKETAKRIVVAAIAELAADKDWARSLFDSERQAAKKNRAARR